MRPQDTELVSSKRKVFTPRWPLASSEEAAQGQQVAEGDAVAA